MRFRDAFEMCSGHKPFCLHCKGTTFVDANHTVAYVAVRILNFNCCSAATVHLNDLLLVLLRVARAIWMSSDSLSRALCKGLQRFTHDIRRLTATWGSAVGK